MTDGNTYAINKHLDEREDYDALQEVTAELEQAESDNILLIVRIEELEAKLAKAQSALKRIARTKPHFAGGTPNEHFMRTWAKEALADSQN